jgi:hypothetical protein
MKIRSAVPQLFHAYRDSPLGGVPVYPVAFLFKCWRLKAMRLAALLSISNKLLLR